MTVTVIENETFMIRPIIESDKETFMRIRKESSEMSLAYEETAFYEYYWEKTLAGEDELSMMVFLKESGDVIATCAFYHMDNDAIEIGIDVDEPMRNQGLGTKILILLVEYLKNNTDQRIIIRTKSNNLRCQRMIAKAGGIKVEEEPTGFDGMIADMISVLEKSGLTETAQKNKDLLEAPKGICVNIYEFSREDCK